MKIIPVNPSCSMQAKCRRKDGQTWRS